MTYAGRVDEYADHGQAKDFVDLHEQVKVRTLPARIIPTS